jgi:DivIVA domain-containing protein
MRSPVVQGQARSTRDRPLIEQGACHPPVSPAWHDQGVPLVFGILVSAAVIFAVFAVTIGRGGSMTNFAPDRPGRPLPEDRVVRAADIGAARFSLAFRGYRMVEVDDALDRLALEIAERDEAIEKLTGQPFEPLVPRGTVPPPDTYGSDTVERVGADAAAPSTADVVANGEVAQATAERAEDDPGTEI